MRIAIIGCGKMGSWLSNCLIGKYELAVYDIDPSKHLYLSKLVRLDKPEDLVSYSPNIVINAVALSKTREAFELILPFLSAECILVDMASIKGGLELFYCQAGRKFVSVHPMFGPTFASMEALAGENAIIIKGSQPECAAIFYNLFQELKINVYEYSFAEHDKMMTYSLTTPFISSLVFASCINSTIVPGTTFARHLQIARGLLAEDDSLLTEVMFNPYSLEQLNQITAKLEMWKHIIKCLDTEEAVKYLGKLRCNVA